MRLLLLTVFLLNVMSLAAAAQPNPDDFQSKAAATAIKSYLKEVEAAKTKYEKIRKEAEMEFQKTELKSRDGLITSLKATLKRELAEANLNESVRIQDAITALEKAKTPSLQPSVVGVWKIRWIGWPECYQSFRVEGNAIMIERRDTLDGPVLHRGTLQKEGDRFSFLYFNNERLDRYSLIEDGRILIEQWNLTHDREAINPAGVIGIATRVE